MRVLVFLNYYLPAYKAGGPLRTIQGMVDYLGDDIEFSIVTSDRDSGDLEPFPGIVTKTWTKLGKSRICYVEKIARSKIACVLEAQSWDVLYLQSFFDRQFTIQPLLWWKFGRLKAKKVLLAPRGEFSRGAIAIKPWKKRMYLFFARVLKLYDNIYWQVSSEYERADLLREIPSLAPISRILIAPDVPPKSLQFEPSDPIGRIDKNQPLKVVFLSRISEKKNLSYAIQVLSKVHVTIEFNIFGPVDENSEYWGTCQHQLEELPESVSWKYCGPITPAEVPKVFAKHDVFLFPTRGENFGHVIFESLHAGCPVLLSDQTPWQDLAQHGVGWVIPLEEQAKYCQSLSELAVEEPETAATRRKNCVNYALEFVKKTGVVEKNRLMFSSLT